MILIVSEVNAPSYYSLYTIDIDIYNSSANNAEINTDLFATVLDISNSG